jgi:hypothetical protein
VHFIPEDILSDQLPSADMLIMGHMLHRWDLPIKMKLLEKVGFSSARTVRLTGPNTAVIGRK